jgi:hypothetical protein
MPAVGIELLSHLCQMTGKGTATNSVSQEFADLYRIITSSSSSDIQCGISHI